MTGSFLPAGPTPRCGNSPSCTAVAFRCFTWGANLLTMNFANPQSLPSSFCPSRRFHFPSTKKFHKSNNSWVDSYFIYYLSAVYWHVIKNNNVRQIIQMFIEKESQFAIKISVWKIMNEVKPMLRGRFQFI